MSQFGLTEEQRVIREMARKFTADATTPFAAGWDEHHVFPRETIDAAFGFDGIDVSEESGGAGPARLECALFMEADTGWSVADRALQLHGGYGYLQDYPIERTLRTCGPIISWRTPMRLCG